ncbi:MAG: helix-turn-helix domain-containing protein [Planctomycetes bacterium]|nr:helix-turn-helix domain-containing protein [Planctomycetota bacterium]
MNSSSRSTPDRFQRDFGRRLAQLRIQKKKLSQASVAAELKVHLKKYSRWEQGYTLPSLPECQELAGYFESTLDFLIGGLEAPNPIRRKNGAVEWMVTRPPRNDGERKAIKCYELAAASATPAEIARSVGLTQDQPDVEVGKFIGDAIQKGLVQVLKVNEDQSLSEELRGRLLAEIPKLQDGNFQVLVASLGLSPRKFRANILGYLASRFLLKHRRKCHHEYAIGLVGGFAVSQMVYHLQRGELQEVTAYPWTLYPARIQVGYSANSLVSHMVFDGEDYRVQGVNLSIANEAEMHALLERAGLCDIVFMGLGSLQGGMSERFATLLYLYNLDPEEVLSNGGVGDVLGYPVRENGELLFEEEIAEKRWSVRPDKLKNLVSMKKPVVGIIFGQEKAPVTLGALRGGTINTLIIDDRLAGSLLARLDEG